MHVCGEGGGGGVGGGGGGGWGGGGGGGGFVVIHWCMLQLSCNTMQCNAIAPEAYITTHTYLTCTYHTTLEYGTCTC